MPPCEGGYKEFLIGRLFDKVPVKPLRYKVNELPKKEEKSYNLPALTAGVLNQGLACFVPRENATILKNVISVSANGANSGVMYYQPKEFTILQDSYAIRFKEKELNQFEYIYLVGALQKVVRNNFNWSNKAGWEKIKKLSITLPTKSKGKIDFQFMESRIRELEEERVRELEAYLSAAGFANCNLTPAEEEALRKFSNGQIKFKKHTTGKLFEIHPTKSYGETNATLFADLGKTPVVVNSSMNNGIGGWINRSATEKGNMLTYSDTTTSDAVFYQPFDFIGYSHVQGFYPKDREWSENELLYFLSVFKKTANGRFDYATKFTRQIASCLDITLPINTDNEIDYDFMETYISAIKKQIIQQLKDFIAKEHAAYQQVIEDA